MYFDSKRAEDPAAFVREHDEELVLLNAANIYFKRKQINPKELNLTELFAQYKELKAEKSDLYKKSGSMKKEIRELEIVVENIEKTIGTDKSQREEKEKQKKKEERDI